MKKMFRTILPLCAALLFSTQVFAASPKASQVTVDVAPMSGQTCAAASNVQGCLEAVNDALVGGGHDAVTVTDTAEIDLTLTGQQISATLRNGSIDEARLDTSVNASLDLADSALQSFSETDPQVGTLTNDKWCKSNGSLVACTTDAPVLSESDPVFSASQAANITGTHITVLGNTSGTNTGDQSLAAYLTSAAAALAYQPLDSDLTYLAGFTPAANIKSILNAADYAALRGLLDLEAGTDFYSKIAADSAFQPLDADLTYLAGFTPTANVKSILNAADYAAIKTLLALTIGTNVQAWDADLDYLAGFTPAANVKSILNAADYAAIKTLLALTIGTDVQAYDADLGSLASGITGLVKGAGNGGGYSAATAGTDYVTAASTNAFTNKTFDANGTGNALSNVETADLATASKSGVDATVITGTKGATDDCAKWNADGDLVSAGAACGSGGGETDPVFTASDAADITAADITKLGNLSGTNTGDQDLSGYQPLDADLTYLAGFTPAANVKSILNAADYAAIKTLLALTIGTNVQAYDADLTTWAGVTPSANGQSLVGALNYAAMRGLLDLEAGTDFYSMSGADAAFQPLDGDLTYLAGFTPAANVKSILNAADYAAIRTLLGLLIGTNVQAYDADLTTYADITPSANVQSILGAANYAAVRTALTLVIGTDVQAYDADLAYLAGFTPTANVKTILNAADYAAVRTALTLVTGTDIQAYDADLTYLAGFTPTANVKSILNAADYAAIKTLLALTIGTNVQAYDSNLTTWAGKTSPSGTVVGTSDTQTLSNKRNTPRITTITSSATPTINTDNADAVTITALAADITSMTTNLSGTPNNFDKLIVRIKDNGTARTIAWGASFEAMGVGLPTTTVISKVLTVGFIYNTVTSKWGCVASAQEA